MKVFKAVFSELSDLIDWGYLIGAIIIFSPLMLIFALCEGK
jgi:hypothetical protein